MGIKVRVLKMSKMSLAVDTPKDVLLVKKIISKLNLK